MMSMVPPHQLNWQRREQPILSAMLTEQSWCRVNLYSPSVIKHQGRYRMWYVGNHSRTRNMDSVLGYAESEDGLHWHEHQHNPILSVNDLPWGAAWQTPHVLFDGQEGRFRMWFVTSTGRTTPEGQLVDVHQRLGCASSVDGLKWQVHRELLYGSCRRPCVIKAGPNDWRMWANSSPDPQGDFSAGLVENIYRFTSTDGLSWTRDAQPVVTKGGRLLSVVYPYVVITADGYTMWYGAHVAGGKFEIYCSTSTDGLRWVHHHERPAFPATGNPNDFDGRYTSTPCVLDDGNRWLLYYSARDWGNLYRTGNGTLLHDSSGIYRHIGVAVADKR